MTPIAFAARMDEILRYLGGLLVSPNPTDWQIGRTFALSSDADRLRYVTSLIEDHAEDTRAHEIGWDLRAIIVGYSTEMTA